MSRELNLYPLSAAGKNIERAFLEDEIDEQTLKDTREMLAVEIENEGDTIVQIYNKFINYLGQGTGANKIVGAIDREIERLKNLKQFYSKGFDRFMTIIRGSDRQRKNNFFEKKYSWNKTKSGRCA